MHAIARFSAESVRLSEVSATGNAFVRSVEFPVNRMVNETNERNEPVWFFRPKDSFIRTGSRMNEPKLVRKLVDTLFISLGKSRYPVETDSTVQLTSSKMDKQ